LDLQNRQQHEKLGLP